MVRESSSIIDLDHQFRRSTAQLFFTTLYVLLVDTVLYTCAIPLFATYLASSCAKLFSKVTPNWELVLAVGITFTLLYTSFTVFGEASYWKYLFAFDHFYASLLTIRDTVNSFILIICLIGLASTVEQMVGDKAMKPHNLSEGSGYVFMKSICPWLNIDHAATLPMVGLKLPHKATMTDPNFGENERYEHAGAYMLLWTMFTSCVGKLVYLNTLFTFLRAMDIFMALKPSFEDDESDELE